MKKAHLYYFSGTYNTKLIADKVKNELNISGYETLLENIENTRISTKHNEADLIGIISPVYGFGLPVPVVRFLNTMPEGKKQKTFVFTSCGGHEGVAIVQCLRTLKSKKYDVIFARKLVMPDTWLLAVNAPTQEKFDKAKEKVEEDIKQSINSIIDDKRKINIANPLLLLLLGFIYSIFYLIGRHLAGKSFITNHKCTSCKTCYSSCPSKTINWDKNNRPNWSWNCFQCFRCINTCPSDAIEISGYTTIAGLVSLFVADIPYRLIPISISNKLYPLNLPLRVFLFVVAAFIFVWCVDRLIKNHTLSRIIPKWYMTTNRKRYKNYN